MFKEQPALVLVTRALRFAAEKHRHQRRKDKRTPYINHPLEVVELLAGVGRVSDPEILAAAALHDTVEDTNTEPSEISEHFGAHVLSLVLECTDNKELSQSERKRLQVEKASEKTPGAKVIK